MKGFQNDMTAEVTISPRTQTGGNRVLILGGGLAGLAAAKRLVDNGFQVELLEKRNILGGKVSSWKDADGDWIETGLHCFLRGIPRNLRTDERTGHIPAHSLEET
jgi:protoporphyrinogen oxidase